MSQVVEFPLEGGGTARVEVEPEDGVAPAGRVVTVAQQSLHKALDPIRPITQSVLDKLRDMPQAPDRLSVEFGVKLSAETGVIIARGTTEANFTVRVEWDRSERAAGDS